MNKNLQAINGQRHTFFGVFVKFDKISVCWHQPQLAFLLKNARNRQATIIINRIWVSSTRQIEGLELKRGDILCLDAIIGKYFGVYKLNHPTKITKVSQLEPCHNDLSKIRNFCIKCGETRDSEFTKTRTHECKKCFHKVTTEWYSKNREKCRLQSKQYYVNNQGKMKTYQKIYREKNKAKISRYFKLWYENVGREKRKKRRQQKPKQTFQTP